MPNARQGNPLQKDETPGALFWFLCFTLLLKEYAIFVVLRWVPYWYGYLHCRSHVIHVFQCCDGGNSLTFTITRKGRGGHHVADESRMCAVEYFILSGHNYSY